MMQWNTHRIRSELCRRSPDAPGRNLLLSTKRYSAAGLRLEVSIVFKVWAGARFCDWTSLDVFPPLRPAFSSSCLGHPVVQVAHATPLDDGGESASSLLETEVRAFGHP